MQQSTFWWTQSAICGHLPLLYTTIPTMLRGCWEWESIKNNDNGRIGVDEREEFSTKNRPIVGSTWDVELGTNAHVRNS